jgi:hypothetical protein
MLSSRCESRAQDTSQSHRDASFGLLVTELDLASAFCQIDSTAANESRTEQIAENAKSAYNSAMYFVFSESDLTAEMRETVQEKLLRLIPLLRTFCSRRVP